MDNTLKLPSSSRVVKNKSGDGPTIQETIRAKDTPAQDSCNLQGHLLIRQEGSHFSVSV
jgi:hypothetical protein